MSGTIKVTWQELAATSSQLQSGAESINTQLATLRSQVSNLGGTWTGGAQASFDSLFEEWRRSADQLNHALTGISQMLAQAGQTYQATEEALINQFSA